MTLLTDVAGLPSYPGGAVPGRPFDPPAAAPSWRASGGLRRARWNGVPVWVVSRYADIETAMSHPSVSAHTRGPLLAAAYDGAEDLPPIFPRMDDPEHARLRRMLVREFTARRSEALRGRVREIATGFLDDLVATGPPADLVADYALPVPSMVISVLLGVPYEDRAFFQEHSAVGFRIDVPREEFLASSAALFAYMLDLVERRRTEPGDDLISRLVTNHVLPGEISAETAAMNGMILLGAGHETTANMISLGLLALLEHPQVLARVRDPRDPAEPARVVDELLRYLSIVQGLVVRQAAADVTIGGQRVRAGEGLIMNLPAGNRDPARWAEPDRLDVERDSRGHLAFGSGVHHCLGQTLARVQLEEAIGLVLRRLPGLRLAVPLEEVEFRSAMSTYGVSRLPVEW
jgi:cytochrome P450